MKSLRTRNLSDVSERCTFDSEPLLAFFLNEEGADVVEDLLEKIQSGEAEGYINIITLTEISYILSRVSPELAEETERNLRLLGLRVVPVEDDGLWREAAHVKAKHSMSLADAFAVATAEAFKSKLVVGSDEEFRELDIQLLKMRE
ncbi:MAG: type II toxin-antitoxin system VapC family toxin [Crenarchaeota archaeon]|nr:type II toxin-antitoxin system VapC family toxin [Thermoproteota archaeon]